jgi:glycosyltransferase involved in cell wall biosynthesis
MHALANSCVVPPLEVEFLGARTDIPALLQRASIAVLPSRREGMPLALLEEMASSLPVVVSDIPELTDLVSDGLNGLVVPVDDVEALSLALQRLLQDADLRRRLGGRARADVERRSTADAGAALERFYETVVAA